MGPPDLDVKVHGQVFDDADPNPLPPSECGYLQPIAAKCLMKFLYGARMARYDIQRAICHTASCVTKWTEQNDLDLYRLVCYMKTTLQYRMVSWVGDTLNDVMIKQFADADLAGDPRTQRSTSASNQKIWGQTQGHCSVLHHDDRRAYPTVLWRPN